MSKYTNTHLNIMEKINNLLNLTSFYNEQMMWKELYEKIKKEREKNNLSIFEFLSACKLDPKKSYYQQLCCKGQNTNDLAIPPSTTEGTVGHEFYTKVKEYFQNKLEGKIIKIQKPTFSDVVNGWQLDNSEMLNDLYISDIIATDPMELFRDYEISYISSDLPIEKIKKPFSNFDYLYATNKPIENNNNLFGNNKTITQQTNIIMDVHVYEECKLTDEEILQIILNDPKISEFVINDKLNLIINRINCRLL